MAMIYNLKVTSIWRLYSSGIFSTNPFSVASVSEVNWNGGSMVCEDDFYRGINLLIYSFSNASVQLQAMMYAYQSLCIEIINHHVGKRPTISTRMILNLPSFWWLIFYTWHLRHPVSFPEIPSPNRPYLLSFDKFYWFLGSSVSCFI